MLLLPNPKRLLLGYLAGAFTTSITVGLAIEYWLADSGVVSTTKHTVNPILDLTLGALLLVLAFALGTGKLAERKERKHAGKPKKTPKWQQKLSKGSARSTFIVGLILTFPGASYLAALTEINKQDLNAAEVVLTVIAVNVVMLILLELPLIGYALAPTWTPKAVERLKDWLARNGARAAVIAATVLGLALIARGAIALAG
jgi:Sap, sulfolipid-1-addressing protein